MFVKLDLQHKPKNELIPIDEDENDEYCSPLKTKKSPVKIVHTPRSEEHKSPQKDAILFQDFQSDHSEGNIKAYRIETQSVLNKSDIPAT